MLQKKQKIVWIIKLAQNTLCRKLMTIVHDYVIRSFSANSSLRHLSHPMIVDRATAVGSNRNVDGSIHSRNVGSELLRTYCDDAPFFIQFNNFSSADIDPGMLRIT